MAETFLNGAKIGSVGEQNASRTRDARNADAGPQLTLAMRTYFFEDSSDGARRKAAAGIIEGRPLRRAAPVCHSSEPFAPGAVRAEASIFLAHPGP